MRWVGGGQTREGMGLHTYPYVHTFLGSLDWRAGGGGGGEGEAEKDFLCGPAQNKLSCSPLSCLP